MLYQLVQRGGFEKHPSNFHPNSTHHTACATKLKINHTRGWIPPPDHTVGASGRSTAHAAAWCPAAPHRDSTAARDLMQHAQPLRFFCRVLRLKIIHAHLRNLHGDLERVRAALAAVVRNVRDLSRDRGALSDNEHPGRTCVQRGSFVAIRCSAELRRAHLIWNVPLHRPGLPS